MKRPLERLLFHLFEQRGTVFAKWLAGWVIRVALIVLGVFLSTEVIAENQEIVDLATNTVAAAILMGAPALYEYYKTRTLKNDAEQSKRIAEAIVLGLERAKKDNVVDFNNQEARAILDEILGDEGKKFVDSAQRKTKA